MFAHVFHSHFGNFVPYFRDNYLMWTEKDNGKWEMGPCRIFFLLSGNKFYRQILCPLPYGHLCENTPSLSGAHHFFFFFKVKTTKVKGQISAARVASLPRDASSRVDRPTRRQRGGGRFLKGPMNNLTLQHHIFSPGSNVYRSDLRALKWRACPSFHFSEFFSFILGRGVWGCRRGKDTRRRLARNCISPTALRYETCHPGLPQASRTVIEPLLRGVTFGGTGAFVFLPPRARRLMGPIPLPDAARSSCCVPSLFSQFHRCHPCLPLSPH